MVYSPVSHKPVRPGLPVTAATAVRSRDASGFFALPQAGLFPDRRFGDISSPLPQSSISYSFAGRYTDVISMLFSVVQFSCLFDPHAIYAISSYRPLHLRYLVVHLPVLRSAILMVFIVHLRGRSMQVPRSAASD